MALTNKQLISLGFKPSVRGRKGLGKTKKYDSLVLSLNDTDFLYTGYNPYSKNINYKTIWKSFKDTDGNRITYQVVNIGDTGFKELQDYIERSNNRNMFMINEKMGYISQPDVVEALNHSAVFKKEYHTPMAVFEGSGSATQYDISMNKGDLINPFENTELSITTETPELDG